MIGIGVAVGLASTVRHALRRRARAAGNSPTA
jgi:hypothetical protein